MIVSFFLLMGWLRFSKICYDLFGMSIGEFRASWATIWQTDQWIQEVLGLSFHEVLGEKVRFDL